MRSRANDEGLLRPTVVDVVISSEFSGCVGSKFRARGRILRDFDILAGAGEVVSVTGSWEIESEAGVGIASGVAACSSATIGVDSLAGSSLGFVGFKVTKRVTAGGEDVDEVPKSRLLHPLSLLSWDWSDKSSKSTLSRRRRRACSRRTIPLVIWGLYPRGSILCLHTGQRELFCDRKSSIHSGWKIWPQESSRIIVSR